MEFRKRILHGEALSILRSLPSGVVQTTVTSPPFYRLRRFDASTWIGGDGRCDHAGAVETCVRCGAWYGELGWEPTVDLYIQHLVQIFREVRRVLRHDGVCWIEIDDSHSGSGRGPTGKNGIGDQARRQGFGTTGVTAPELPAKNMMLVPERLALALQQDGWILRRRIIWVKASSPECVRDRPTRAHSNILMLSKSSRYLYDFMAAMDPARGKAPRRSGGGKFDIVDRAITKWNPSFYDAVKAAVSMRYCCDVWVFPPGRYKGPHTATFPPELPERCIKLSTSEKGACAECGAPRARQAERRGAVLRDWVTLGWKATCECRADETAACIVLDPFAGSGTTLQVARWLGRDYLGIEANAGFIDLIHQRLRKADQRIVELEVFRRLAERARTAT